MAECSRRRFNRISNWPFISRLLCRGFFPLEFICRTGHVIGTVPSPSNGLEASKADLERECDMARIEFLQSCESCEPSLLCASRSSLFFIGQDSRGNWGVMDPAGLCGGLFVNRCEALRFAMLDNGRSPRAVIMVPAVLEFSIGGLTNTVANDLTGLAEAKSQPTAELQPHDLSLGQPRKQGFMVAVHG
jgi:hypothetical protein